MFTVDETRARNAIFTAAINALGDLPTEIGDAYMEHAAVAGCDLITGEDGSRVLFEGGVDLLTQALTLRMQNRPLGLCIPNADPTMMRWPSLVGFTAETQACAEIRLLCEASALHVQRIYEKSVANDPQVDRQREFLMSACVQTGVAWARAQVDRQLPVRPAEVLDTVGYSRAPAAPLPAPRPAPAGGPRP